LDDVTSNSDHRDNQNHFDPDVMLGEVGLKRFNQLQAHQHEENTCESFLQSALHLSHRADRD